MKSSKSKKPKTTLRERVLAVVLSKNGRRVISLTFTVAAHIIMQHSGTPDLTVHILLV